MRTLRECIQEAEEKKVAIGHFNISNLEALHAIYRAAKRLSVPVIIGLSEGEEQFFGRNEAEALIAEIRKKDGYPIFVNADHHHSFESFKQSIDAGYDMAIIDEVKLAMEKNISVVKQCVAYAKKKSEKDGRDILVEAELGFIGASSKLLDKLPEGVSEETMTRSEDAAYFVRETGIDLLAPSVGNVHGIVKGGNPRLHPDRIKEIRAAAGVPLVLHGGSGIADQDFVAAIQAGISVIHINTEIRMAYHEALQKFLEENPSEVAPYKYLEPAIEAVYKVVLARLKLFNGIT